MASSSMNCVRVLHQETVDVFIQVFESTDIGSVDGVFLGLQQTCHHHVILDPH